MTRCTIAIGSNLGNRGCHVRFAFRELGKLPRTRVLKKSKVRASAPMGKNAGNEYLNAAAIIQTDLSPIGLLVELKRLEAIRGRRPDGHWHPRTLDLDILTYGKDCINKRILKVPHPGTGSRAFVQTALADF